jgi:hypothetical protein
MDAEVFGRWRISACSVNVLGGLIFGCGFGLAVCGHVCSIVGRRPGNASRVVRPCSVTGRETREGKKGNTNDHC